MNKILTSWPIDARATNLIKTKFVVVTKGRGKDVPQERRISEAVES